MKTINKIKCYPDHTVRSVKIKDKTFYVCNICGRLSHKAIRKDKKIWCSKHYSQISKFHRILDPTPRTIFDRNEIHIDGDVCYIDLYDKNCNKVATGKFDTEDLNKIQYLKWRYRHGYIACTGKKHGDTYFMHRLILNTNQIVEHINHDTLDNRKCNLKIVTKPQNEMNTNFKGVSKTPNNKYYARIKINQKMINLGVYLEEDEAYFARWYAEKILFKEYAYEKQKPIIAIEREQQIMEYIDKKVQRL